MRRTRVRLCRSHRPNPSSKCACSGTVQLKGVRASAPISVFQKAYPAPKNGCPRSLAFGDLGKRLFPRKLDAPSLRSKGGKPQPSTQGSSHPHQKWLPQVPRTWAPGKLRRFPRKLDAPSLRSKSGKPQPSTQGSSHPHQKWLPQVPRTWAPGKLRRTQCLPEGGNENSPGRKPWEKPTQPSAAPEGRHDPHQKRQRLQPLRALQIITPPRRTINPCCLSITGQKDKKRRQGEQYPPLPPPGVGKGKGKATPLPAPAT